jgi:hypothetical protein
MKSFLQHLTEAGIRRKMRVAQATDTAALSASLDPMASPSEKRAAAGTARLAASDVKREQASRTGRVLRRAQTEAEARVPAPTTGGIYAHVERLGRVGEIATGFAGQMANVEKPGFIRARERRSFSS